VHFLRRPAAYPGLSRVQVTKKASLPSSWPEANFEGWEGIPCEAPWHLPSWSCCWLDVGVEGPGHHPLGARFHFPSVYFISAQLCGVGLARTQGSSHSDHSLEHLGSCFPQPLPLCNTPPSPGCLSWDSPCQTPPEVDSCSPCCCSLLKALTGSMDSWLPEP
jgi:hypothetical protein